MTDSPLDIANKIDREFFATHPGVKRRVRLAVPGEVPLPGDHLVEVIELAPGVRLRMGSFSNTRRTAQ